jgi:hypothetical protein
MEPNNLQSGEYINKRKNKKQQKTSHVFCVSGKGKSFTAATFDLDVRTLPLPTMKPRYSVSRLAQTHLTILRNNLFSRKAVNTCRR